MLGSYKRKKDSIMVVAKREGKEKPTKIEQRKVQGQVWEPQGKQTALLAVQFTKGRLRGREKKTYIERSKNWAEGFSSLCVLWFGLPWCLEGVFSFACQIKLSCNTGLSITSNFCCGKTEPRKLQTTLTAGNNSYILIIMQRLDTDLNKIVLELHWNLY